MKNETNKIPKANYIYDVPPDMAEASLQVYLKERRFLSLITKGDLDGLQNFLENTKVEVLYRKKMSDAMLKNHIALISIALVVRAAIEGGLDCSIAFYMSNHYTDLIYNSSGSNEISSILEQAVYDFTSHVATIKQLHTKVPVVEAAIRYIQRYINKSIQVNEIASYLHMNSDYLSHTFKAETGISLKSYIHKMKCEEAKILLKTTKMSLTELSHYLGYSTQSHFQNTFKKLTGITPQEYKTTPVNTID